MQCFDLKLNLIGDSRVGKSQLSRSCVNKQFMNDAQVTVGIEFQTKVFEFEKSLIRAHVWDTAGQDRLHGMTKAYYRNSAGAILVFDVGNRASFENIQNKWLKQYRDEGYTDVRLILVGNKTDLITDDNPRAVSVEEAVEYAKTENIDYIETSALTGENVDHMFRRIALSVARVLPEVAIHLEVSYLPDGWMATYNNTGTAADSGAVSGLSVSDISAVMMEEEVAKQLSPPQRTKSPLAAEAATLRQVYLNYWTGESVEERPCFFAPLCPGLIYAAKEIDPLTGKIDPRGSISMMKERTSSCKTTATYNSAGFSVHSGSGRNHSQDQEDYGSLSESRRSISAAKEESKVRACFKCMCPIS